MRITCKTTLLPPSFVGTRFDITLDAGNLTWGIYNAKLAEGSSFIRIDWGDGNTEIVESGSKLKHTYAEPGKYRVELSDDVQLYVLNSTASTSEFHEYIKAVIGCESVGEKFTSVSNGSFLNAVNLRTFDVSQANLTNIVGSAFSGCMALEGAIYLPTATTLATQPFGGAPLITELHFAAANRDRIESLPGFARKFGAPNATISFDL